MKMSPATSLVYGMLIDKGWNAKVISENEISVMGEILDARKTGYFTRAFQFMQVDLTK